MRTLSAARKRLTQHRNFYPPPGYRLHDIRFEDNVLVAEASVWVQVLVGMPPDDEIEVRHPMRYRRVLIYYLDTEGNVVDVPRTLNEHIKQYAPFEVVDFGYSTHYVRGFNNNRYTIIQDFNIYIGRGSILREKLKLLIAE